MDSVWYNELGFYNNPFSIKPAAFHNEVFGNSSEVDEIVRKISEPGMVFVFGDFGSGKTTLMKKVVSNFGGGFGKKVIYYNCNQSERSIKYNDLLVGAGGFLRRLFSVRKKGMILLLDEAQDMNLKDMERVVELFDEGFFRTVVFVSKDENLKLGAELKKRVGENKFKLADMGKEDAVKMIRERIGDVDFISDEVIGLIFEKDKNSRNFLKNCEDICRYAFEGGKGAVKKDMVGKVLKN